MESSCLQCSIRQGGRRRRVSSPVFIQSGFVRRRFLKESLFRSGSSFGGRRLLNNKRRRKQIVIVMKFLLGVVSGGGGGEECVHCHSCCRDSPLSGQITSCCGVFLTGVLKAVRYQEKGHHSHQSDLLRMLRALIATTCVACARNLSGAINLVISSPANYETRKSRLERKFAGVCLLKMVMSKAGQGMFFPFVLLPTPICKTRKKFIATFVAVNLVF